MSPVDLTKTSAAPETRDCPPWCVRDHATDPTGRNFRQHRAQALRGPDSLYVALTQNEPLTALAATYIDTDPTVYFTAGDEIGVLLPVQEAADLAVVLTALGRADAAELLRKAVEPVCPQEAAPNREVRYPPHILCEHCKRRISREYGTWRHCGNEHEECNPDTLPVVVAAPVNDPVGREFASELIGRRVGVTLQTGEYLAGVLVQAQDWFLMVKGADRRHPDAMRDVRVEIVRQLQPIAQHEQGPGPLDFEAAWRRRATEAGR